MAGSISDSEQRRRELAAFLLARRSRLRPELVGIHVDPARRRVRGLRREEVAHLSKVSYSWYTRLEQGKDVHATAEVIDSIANALQLTDDELRHLRRLAALPLGPRDGGDVGVDEDVRRLLERMLPAPAYVVGPRSEYLAWNDALVAVFCDIGQLPPEHRSALWAIFTVPKVRSSLVDWEEHARLVVGQFRAEAASHPTTPDSRSSQPNWQRSVPSFATGGRGTRWSEPLAESNSFSIRTSACCLRSSCNFG